MKKADNAIKNFNMKTYEELLHEARRKQAEVYGLQSEAELAKKAEVKQKGIKGWLGYNFESSSGLTEEFADFSKDIKIELKKIMTGYELISYNRGHFYFSAFFKNIINNKFVYISSDDVRGSDRWYTNLLVRTAKNDKDYTGGSNDWSTLPLIKEKADYLIK